MPYDLLESKRMNGELTTWSVTSAGAGMLGGGYGGVRPAGAQAEYYSCSNALCTFPYEECTRDFGNGLIGTVVNGGLYFILNDVVIASILPYRNQYSQGGEYTMFILINPNNNTALIMGVRYGYLSSVGQWEYAYSPLGSENASLYQWVNTIEPEPPTYTWQSVAGVSGKGQTYSLSQIASASINNGESVTGASASAFDSLTAQVSTMVTDDSAMSGADAGGISGSGSNSGNQSSGYASR